MTARRGLSGKLRAGSSAGRRSGRSHVPSLVQSQCFGETRPRRFRCAMFHVKHFPRQIRPNFYSFRPFRRDDMAGPNTTRSFPGAGDSAFPVVRSADAGSERGSRPKMFHVKHCASNAHGFSRGGNGPARSRTEAVDQIRMGITSQTDTSSSGWFRIQIPSFPWKFSNTVSPAIAFAASMR